MTYAKDATGPFYHGTRADLAPGDLLAPGNPTQPCRSRAPLRVVGEAESWQPHPPERVAEMKAFLARLDAEGGPQIID